MRSRFRRFTDGLASWLWPRRPRGVGRVLRVARKWRRKHPPRCYRCGFDLTGSRHLDTCPECGRACEWGAHWTRDGRWTVALLVSAAAAGPLVALAGFAVVILVERIGIISPAPSLPFVAVFVGAAVGLPAGVCSAVGAGVRTRSYRAYWRRTAATEWAFWGSLILLWLGWQLLAAASPSN
ncbi:MAG: hypothetical protein ACF8QF_09465 [Phycisphaerales bacterium]